MSSLIKQELAQEAEKAGFDVVGVAPADALGTAGAYLNEFLARDRHGTMDWMERRKEQRGDPQTLWPQVRSIVMLGMNYGPESDPLAVLAQKERGAISVYARGGDYHDLIKKRLKRVARWLHETSGEPVKVFVDTAPVMEKPLAVLAGLGWQGKHTNLVSRDKGSWLFLGAIYTAASIAPDESGEDHCGSCRDCLDICPTDAFPAPYQLDARRCISYLTIEYKGHIAHEFRANMGNRIFGCDDCLAVCPWNKFAQKAGETRFHAREQADSPPLKELLGLDDRLFRERFAGSPIKRTGRDRFLRNVLIAAGNSGCHDLRPAVAELLEDGSPLVRAMAVWASAQLFDPVGFDTLRKRYEARETDEYVGQEWRGLK